MEQSVKKIYTFEESKIPHISEVGGKGYSLVKMKRGGLNVPPGFVLV